MLNKLKADARAAMVARKSTEAALINTVVGEVENIPASRKLKSGEATWPATDEEIRKVITSFMKNIQITIGLLKDRGRDTSKDEEELAILSRYVPVPVEVSEGEIQEAISDILLTLADRSPRQMGVVMGELKKRFPDVDGKNASTLVKAALGL